MGHQLSACNVKELTMMALYSTLAALLTVTVISAAQIKTPIVSFDDDVTAAAATELPESEAEMSTSAPEHGDADKPERLVALLSGVYSASAGYQPSADDLKTVAEIANNQIPFKDLNQKQLSVIGRVIGAMQTGAVSADEASDDDYIRLNVATLPVKAPSGIYASGYPS